MVTASSSKPNAIVFDLATGDHGLEYVSDGKGPLRFYKGEMVYLLRRTREGELQEIELTAQLGTPPEKLYRSLNWPIVKEVRGLPPSRLEKLNTYMGLGLVGILVGFLFLVVMTSMG